MKPILHKARACALFFILSFSISKVHSQSVFSDNGRFEAGIGLGPMFFLGDLGGSAGIGTSFLKDVDLPMTKLSKSLYASTYPSEWIGFRLAFNQGVLEGNDAQAPDKGGAEIYRKNRNLSFKTNIIEGYVGMEIYPTVFIEKYDGLIGKLRPYGFLGIGAFHFNPKAKDNSGNWVALQPLRTEGQGMAEYPDRKPYSLTQLEIPMGVGFKYYIKENMYIGMEVLHRKLFTDYVDDVSTNYIDPIYFNAYLNPADAAKAQELHYRSLNLTGVTNPGAIAGEQRGDPKDKDAFFSTNLRIGIRFNNPNSQNARARRQMRCPVYY